MTTETRVSLTCDQCGKQQLGPGIVGWWRIDQHPEVVDTWPLHIRRPPFDLCSLDCISAFVVRRRKSF